MTRVIRPIVLHACLILGFSSFPTEARAQVQTDFQTSVGRPDRPDVVIEWNAIIMGAVGTQSGVEQVRIAAIAHLAVFEAVNAIDKDFEPYLGTVVAPAGASAEAAAVAAAHGVLVHYLVNQSDEIDALREASLAKIPDGPGKKSGLIVGEAAALALVMHRENDGSKPEEWYDPQQPPQPGQWQRTPSCPPEGGLFFHWSNLQPFGIRSGDQFRSVPPPALTSPRFARHYNEVKDFGRADSEERSPHQTVVAQFYAAVQSQSVWNPVARKIAMARRSSLSQNARLFALLNMAMNDGLIAVMDTKYAYTFWRPETAIHSEDTDPDDRVEPDPGFEPLIRTPCHPSYPSAHASSSYAAREVLERIFGEVRLLITLTSPAVPGVKLRYKDLSQITDDIDLARIYGGIHFRFDQQAGARQGRRVGRYVATHSLREARRY
jgi:hypothetical protein